MEASTVCKLFYHASRKNKLFIKKLDDSRKLFTCDKRIFDTLYGDVFISFSNFTSKNMLMKKNCFW